MQKIIPGSEVSKLDEKYIHDKNLNSFDLMERAAGAFCDWYIRHFGAESALSVFCGTGNNGGDGLAIARMLYDKGYEVNVFYIGDLTMSSKDFHLNFEILPDQIAIKKVSPADFTSLESEVLIDAVFGVGINRPLSGDYLSLVKEMNAYPAIKIAVDLPSGLPADEVLEGEAFKADYTLSFQFPKLSLLFPEHAGFSGKLQVVDIGIDPCYFDDFQDQTFYVQRQDLYSRHKKFDRFSHKGTFGKVLLIGGSYGKMGSIRLSSQAALRTGSGLVSCFVPRCGVEIVQISIPEVMVENSEGEFAISKKGLHGLDRFDALGVGPGMGTSGEAKECLEFILQDFQKPTVLDADALNILSSNPHLLVLLRENVLLTPHLVEFERLVGRCANHKERIQKASEFSKKNHCVLILKGANTVISTPDGSQFFNSSGTHYMATAGAGDALTGVLTSFLGQGYTPTNAAICGVYHHGLAGELAADATLRGTTATDIIEKIPKSFLKLNIA